VVKEQLQPPNNLLLAAAQKRDDLVGTQKTMPVDEPDEVSVAFRQLDGSNRGNAFEARQSFFHPAIVAAIEEMRETAEVAGLGNFNLRVF
jgi:hypothetical protein